MRKRMFNAKLKMQVKELKNANNDLSHEITRLLDEAEKAQKAKALIEQELKDLKNVLDAQGLLCAMFAHQVMLSDINKEEPKKRGPKKGSKRKVGKGKPGPKPKEVKIVKKGKKNGKKKA